MICPKSKHHIWKVIIQSPPLLALFTQGLENSLWRSLKQLIRCSDVLGGAASSPRHKALAVPEFECPGACLSRMCTFGVSGKGTAASLAIPWFLLQLLTATWARSGSRGQPAGNLRSLPCKHRPLLPLELPAPALTLSALLLSSLPPLKNKIKGNNQQTAGAEQQFWVPLPGEPGEGT